MAWDFYALRNAWNQAKPAVAPWWADNSKEAYASGIADAATALKNWSDSKNGTRKGKRVGFPRFESKHRARNRIRFTTGAIRVEPDRRTITLPRIGGVAVEGEHPPAATAHPGREGPDPQRHPHRARWAPVRGVRMIVAQQRPAPARPDATAGVDLGLRVLATVADTTGAIIEYPNPAPLRATLTGRRRVARQASRRIVGSRGHRAAKAKLAALDRRAVNLRKQAAHQLTTRLARTYGTVVVEDLDIAAMKRGMGRRAFRRAVSDAAMGQVRPMLAYKTAWHGGRLVVADRWYPSSKIHHGCGCRLVEPRKLAKYLACAVTGEVVDRDGNAARNLRDWPDNASLGVVDAQAPQAHPGGGQAHRVTGGRGRDRKTQPSGRAGSDEARTRKGTPRRGAA